MVETAGSGEVAERARLAPPPPSLPVPVPARIRLRPPGLGVSIGNALEGRRFFLLLPFAMIAGLIGATLAPDEPAPWALGLVAAGIGAALVFQRRRLVATRVLVLAGSFWLGFCLLAIHGGLFGTPMLERPVYGQFTARVDEIVARGQERTTLIVSAITPQSPGEARPPMRRARVSVQDAPVLAPGDVISGRLRFYPVPAPVVPNGYDAQFASYFQGIGAYGSAIGPLTVAGNGVPAAPTRLIDSVRSGIAARIAAALGQPSASIAEAIVIGDQAQIPDEVRDAMARAGIAHVLSISGLHLSLVAGGLFAACRLLLALMPALTRRINGKKLAALGGIAAGLGYFSISGGSVAALRSTIMIVLVFGAVLAGRRAITMRNIAVAAILVILSDPAGVFRPSFQLSFAAVVALVGAFESWQRGPPGRGWLGRTRSWITGAIVTSFVAGAATALFSIYHFAQAAPLGVVGNLMALPLVAFVIMPAGVLGVLAIPLGFDRPFFGAMGWGIDRMLDCARLVAGLSRPLEVTPLLAPSALVIALAALAWFAFLADRWRLFGPALAVPAVLALGLDRAPDVLISDTTQAVAVRGADGLVLVTGKPGAFATRVWAESYGQAEIGPAEGFARCDSLGCLARSPAGFTVAVVEGYDAFAEDCVGSDLVVTHLYAPAYCRSETTVIDVGDLRRNGSYWLAWEGGRFVIRPSVTGLNRPWRAAQR